PEGPPRRVDRRGVRAPRRGVPRTAREDPAALAPVPRGQGADRRDGDRAGPLALDAPPERAGGAGVAGILARGVRPRWHVGPADPHRFLRRLVPSVPGAGPFHLQRSGGPRGDAALRHAEGGPDAVRVAPGARDARA